MTPNRDSESTVRPTTSAAHVVRALLAISVLSIAMMTIGAFLVSYHFLHAQTLRHLNTLLAVTTIESVTPLQFHDAATATEVLRAIPRQEGIVLAQIRDADDNVLAEVKDRNDRIGLLLARWIGTERLSQDVVDDNRRLGSITLDGGSGPLLRVLGSLLGWSILVMFAVALTCLVLARRYTRQITRPIFELRDVVKRLLDHRDFSQRAPPSDLQEVEDLRLEFNDLLDEIGARDRLLQHSNAALKRAAYIDTLTGLPNRAMFEQALLQAGETATRKNDRIGLLYLDIDGFKRVNDTFGHAAGDVLLAEVGARLRAWQSKNTIAARIGGDEFVLLIAPAGDTDIGGQLSADLQATLDAPIDVADHVLHPGISVGYAVYPDTVAEADLLIEIADHAMYDVKQLRYQQKRTTRWEKQRDEGAPPRRQETL